MAVLLVLAACGENQQSSRKAEPATRVPMPVIEATRAQFGRPLVATNGDFLDVKDVIEDGERLLVLNGKPEELWELPMAPPHTLRRLSAPREFGQASVRAMTAHSSGISFLGLDGKLRVMSSDAPEVLARTVRAWEPMQRPVALGEWRDGQWIAVHLVLTMKSTAVLMDSVIVSTLDREDRVTRVYAFERAGPSRADKLFLDVLAGRALRGQVILVGNAPLRVITISADSVRVDTLLDAPLRPIDEAELAKLRRELADSRTPQFALEAPLLTREPAAAALPISGGYLVVAQAGSDVFVADLYCGVRFRKTVLSRTSISGMFVTQRGLAVVDEPEANASESPSRLSYYRASDFISECTQ